MRFVPPTLRALFLDRPNRFVVECRLGGRRVRAHLPNPGRLLELLLPGRVVHLAPRSRPGPTGLAYTAVAVEDGRDVIFLHTQRTNAVARSLLEARRIPGLEAYSVVGAEVPVGRRRFDFLLAAGRRRLLLEVKSCTLCGRSLAMFPDAVTARGREHLLALAEQARGGTPAGVLFVVHASRARAFLPDYHTDPAFAEALASVRHRIRVQAVAVTWRSDLTLDPEVHDLPIPWEILARENRDRGSYLLVLHLPRKRRLEVGSLGVLSLERGFYVYAGSALGGLTRRIARHRRAAKRPHWHVDSLRRVSRLAAVFPIRSGQRLECDLARGLAAAADWTVPGFGASDCACPSHLYGMAEDPRRRPAFVELLVRFRMDRPAADPGRATAGEGPGPRRP